MSRKYNTIQVRIGNLCLEKDNEKYISFSFAFRLEYQFMGQFLLVKVLITLKLSNVGSSKFVNGGHNKICKVHVGLTSHHPQSHTTKMFLPYAILIKVYIHFSNGRIQSTLKQSPH
jgi:hypothetical protein